MSANPVEAGRKGGQSRSAAKLAAARRNGFQKTNVRPLPMSMPKEPASTEQKTTPKPVLFAAREV
jgi:hypothetical protein